MTRVVTDQMGRAVLVSHYPQRIISLVPSQTELLFDLGLENQLIGITKFCVHPTDKVKSKIKIGGTKQFNLELIDQLKPDLIIGNKEENYREGIEALERKYPVWMSNITDLESALDMIRQVGEITATRQKADQLASRIENGFAALPHYSEVPAAYFIWKEPWMAAGSGTFIDLMLQKSGFINVLADLAGRYPAVTVEAVEKLKPRVILLSSEPYPFKEKHAQELRTLFPDTKVLLVDGEVFSWYGSRLLMTPDYLKQLRKELDHA